MDIEKVCNEGKCGLCCFLYNLVRGYTLNNPSEKFLKENCEKIISDGKGNYFTKPNPELKVLRKYVKEPDMDRACSFLIPEIENDTIISLKCSIHDSDYRPIVCKTHKSYANESYLVMHFDIPKFELNGKVLNANKDIEAIINNSWEEAKKNMDMRLY
ncbi:MAG: hypothetical protein PHN56_04430 [Candidatus Nanoarchaeia archaeon]|nr:hypothetical protein [Candidatus Nanoarchaeia archaeon]